MAPIRVGAVSYLNARPLVWGLERWPEQFDVRYDLPSACAELLHRGETDLGLIPSVEYLARADYRIVPGVAVVSDGPVASVAIFASKPIERVASIALDTSSRTSVALVRVLCAKHFGIAPRFEPYGPDLDAMARRADAALLIGDPALFADYERLGLQKIDLGAEWQSFTGLPFVYAFWAGLPGRVDAVAVEALQHARDVGVAAIDDVTAEFFPGDEGRRAIGAAYLRANIRFTMAERELAGLERFFALAAEVGAAAGTQRVRHYS